MYYVGFLVLQFDITYVYCTLVVQRFVVVFLYFWSKKYMKDATCDAPLMLCMFSRPCTS